MKAIAESDDAPTLPDVGAMSSSILRAYLLVWCLSWSLPVGNMWFLGGGDNAVGGLDERPLVKLDYFVLLPLVGLLWMGLLFFRSRWMLLSLAILVHVVDLAIRWDRMPFVWDHEQWAMQVELAFVVIFGLQQVLQSVSENTYQRTAETIFLRTVRRQFAMFYMAATFWKINTSFLNVDTSCGSVLILELVGTYLPVVLSPSSIHVLAWVAPHITLVTELLLGTLMWLAAEFPNIQLYRFASIWMGSLFHLSIFMLPVNGAGGFSMDCVRHFLLFFEPHEWSRPGILSSLWGWPSIGYGLTVAQLLALRLSSTGQGFDFGFFGMCVLICFYGHLSVISYHSKSPLSTAPNAKADERVEKLFRMSSTAVLFSSFMYAFAGPVLGIQHMGAPTMYSNLRYYNGGNHLLVPTSILPPEIVYGGSLVRVLNSTCPSLNQRLAYIRSKDVFPPTPLHYMETALTSQSSRSEAAYQLFPLCMSNPHSRAVLGELYAASNPPKSASFVPFILPISEVRKSLAEATAKSESYTVVLADPAADIANMEEDETVVVLDSSGNCRLDTPKIESKFVGTCANNRLAREVQRSPSNDSDKDLPPILGSLLLARLAKALVEKLLTPYPELIGWDEEACMS